MDSRIIHFIKKEFIQMFRDRRMLYVALFAPVIQLIAFGYIASTDIKHISMAVLDEDKTYYSRTYLQSYKNSGYFDLNYYLNRTKEMNHLLDGGRVKAVLHVPRGFGKKLVRNQPASVQIIIDGSNSSQAMIVQGYIEQINLSQARVILEKRLRRMGINAQALQFMDTRLRVWYNPELKSVNFMVPALFAQVLLMVGMILTTASVVKEKEKGTMEMLAVTPLKPYELILGKLLPFALVSLVEITFIFLVATLWFKVPMRGNILLLFSLAFLFMLTSLGLGLFISTISRTQRQAIMTNVFVMAPQFILSGFIFPIANMPKAIQLITYFTPLRYFLEIVRGIFLKGVRAAYLWNQIWPLCLFGVALLGLSIIRFKKKLD